MLPLAAVLFVVAVCWVAWKRSRLPLFDFFGLWVAYIYVRLWHRLTGMPKAPFPVDRPCIVISNHTCSADPMFILAGCRRPVGFVVAHEHFSINLVFRGILDGLHSVAVKRGGRDAGAVRRILRTLAAGRSLCLFPEGGLSGVGLGKMRHGKAGMAYLALKTRLPVFPVHIEGGPRTHDLLRSWIYPSPKAVRVHYGQAVDLSAFRDRPLTRQLVEQVNLHLMRQLRELGAACGLARR